jgi:4-hydroxybenzoate polyprenyltransferase
MDEDMQADPHFTLPSDRDQRYGCAAPATLAVSLDSTASPVRRWAVLPSLLRCSHWIKNVFVLAPLLFSLEFLNPPSIFAAVHATLLFCLAASAVYVFNDYHDRNRDILNPVNAARPLACGAVSPSGARQLIILLIVMLAMGGVVSPGVLTVICVYLLLNVGYTLRWRQVPMLELLCVTAGFGLRVLAGAVAISVPLSPWMLTATLCLACFMVVGKRRSELLEGLGSSRSVLCHYTPRALDFAAVVSACGAIACYLLYVSLLRPELWWSAPLVVLGIGRYWIVFRRHNRGCSPTSILYRDPVLQGIVLSWSIVCLVSLWPVRTP